jgi:hypothetical protein
VTDRCNAIVETADPAHGGKHYSMQRVTVMGSKPCGRKSIELVGHLKLCTVHARMAREGLIDKSGVVAPRDSIRDARRYPKRFPGGIYTWWTGRAK